MSNNAVPILSASEVSEYVFCPEAWYLSRHGVVGNAKGAQNRKTGIAAHRSIGLETDRLLGLQRLERALLLAIVVVVLLVGAFALQVLKLLP